MTGPADHLSNSQKFAEVIKPHVAEDPSQLNLEVGEVVCVLEKHESGWWGGNKIHDRRKGWFPRNSVRLAEQDNGVENSCLRQQLVEIQATLLQTNEELRAVKLARDEYCGRTEAAEMTLVELGRDRARTADELVQVRARAKESSQTIAELEHANGLLMEELEALRGRSAAAELSARKAQIEKFSLLEELGRARGEREAASQEVEELRRKLKKTEGTCLMEIEELKKELAKAIGQCTGVRRVNCDRHGLRAASSERHAVEDRTVCLGIHPDRVRPAKSNQAGDRGCPRHMPTPARSGARSAIKGRSPSPPSKPALGSRSRSPSTKAAKETRALPCVRTSSKESCGSGPRSEDKDVTALQQSASLSCLEKYIVPKLQLPIQVLYKSPSKDGINRRLPSSASRGVQCTMTPSFSDAVEAVVTPPASTRRDSSDPDDEEEIVLGLIPMARSQEAIPVSGAVDIP